MKKKIFVFGSNLAGRHIKGSALRAYQEHGAVYGEGVGLQGNSYAIPVRDEEFAALSLTKIQRYINQFIRFAELNPHLEFEVSRLGCGETAIGYDDEDIAPMIANAPMNCTLPVGWRSVSLSK